ncbi:MAG: efflux RND transporter permease subunit [Candidatus Kerfeldbacteria bacterium]|nr:efflux RND transporter permease subunit [Candidatus Kerfeldbacteria bacterium]
MADERQHSEHPYDWNAKLVRFFLHNPRLVWLIVIITVLGGLFALSNFQRQGFPAVSPKVVLVQTVFPGATAEEMERQVTSLIESAVKDVKGLKDTSSTSANSFSNVVVTLDESVDLDNGIQEVQTKVQSIQSDLPAGAENPKIETFSTSGPAFIFGITNADQNLDDIRRDADAVIQELSDVDGVKSVKLFVPAPERITVAFDPAKLAAAGVSLQTLQLALQGSNVNFPAGTLDLDGQTQSVVSVGAFGALSDISNLLVGVDARSGRPVRLSDVATVSRGYESNASIDRFAYIKDGTLQRVAGVLVAVEVTSDADVIRTKAAIDEHLAAAQTKNAALAGVVTVELSNIARDTSEQINEIVEGALGSKSNLWVLGGIQLLFLAMLVFVNWRAAVTAALAIPLSMLFTFFVLALTGTQLNTIVLFSLILVLGLIVDPAIVMIESIQRYRDLKYSKEEAILESGRRFGSSLFMAVLVAMVVFFPFGVVSGIFGEIIKYIPITVIPALIASYLIPIAILPMLTKWFLKTHKPAHEHDHKADESMGLWRAAHWFMKVGRNVLATRGRQVVVLVTAFLLVGASVSLVGMGQVNIVQFSTPEDNQIVTIEAKFQPGVTFADREQTARQLEDMVLQEPAVAKYFYYSQNRDGLYLFTELKPKSERRDTAQASKQVVARLKDKAKSVARLNDILINELGTGTPEASYQIQVQLNDNDPVVLEAAAKEVGNYLRSLDHVIRVDDGFSGSREQEVRITLDRTKVQAAGLSSFEVGQQLKAIIGETTVTKYAGEGGAADVILKNGGLPTNLEAIRNLPLATRTGQIVRVRDVAAVDEADTLGAIQRFNGRRYVSVRARLDSSDNLVPVQQKFNEYLTDEKLASLGIDSRDSRGEFDDIAKSFQQLGLALAAAILLTYTFLSLQFKSFSQPLIMLVTVPLSLTGVFPALWATGSDLGFLELLGVTILVGIVVSVGIFLMDYANQLMKERGMTAKEAIIQATGVRFRPIMLTKLVVFMGLLPLAIESEFWRGLAVVIMAGIGLSGFLSLIVLPILYVWIQGGRARFHRRVSRTS